MPEPIGLNGGKDQSAERQNVRAYWSSGFGRTGTTLTQSGRESLIEEVEPNKAVICSDSSGAQQQHNIHNMQSDARHNILLYITQTIHTTRRARVDVTGTCPAHIGVEGNGATKRGVVCMNVRYSKAEIKSVIKTIEKETTGVVG